MEREFENKVLTPKTLRSLGATLLADAERQLQESEGRIPPLTRNQACRGYGRRQVKAWESEGRITPGRKGKKGLLYKHSELERCRMEDMTVADWVKEGGLS